jgi:cation diffusion facilitator CzcD-associated flavoprotein CzcO
VPPPYESVQRCERHKGFSIRFGEGWLDLKSKDGSVDVHTAKTTHTFDAVIVCTGFDVNLTDRPEVAPFRNEIETWADRVSESDKKLFPEEARFPYLGDAFQLRGKNAELARVHVFNWGSTMSHGALAGDIPGLETGARRLATGIVRDLFLEDADRHWERVQLHNEDELKPTRYFVPLDKRR